MWKIRTIKSDGRKALKRNFVACLLVSLIMVFIVTGPISISENIDDYSNYLITFADLTGSKTLEDGVNDIIEFEKKFRDATSIGDESSEGFISGLYRGSKTTGTAAGGFLLILDKLFLKGEVSTAIVTGLGTILAFFFLVFIENILRVGSARFYMENKNYRETPISRILFIFRVKRVKHTAWIMLTRIIFNGLWLFTIVGGVIKFYSYRMIPYIIAENPDISRKEAFRLSMAMMKGNKFKAFLLDASFIHWWILSVITFGIVQYLYLGPYMKAAYAELYLEIRKEFEENSMAGAESFPDKYLTAVPESMPEESTPGIYPQELYIIPMKVEKKGKVYDYHRSYSIWNLILMFFVFAMVGWIWECTLQIIQDGHFVNRGSLYGPWVPIYGFGGIGLVVLLKRFADHPIITFFMGVVLCGLLEGLTGWYMDAVRGMKYWDYSGFYFNIHGYVCLEGLLVFGLGGCLAIYLLAPMLDTYLNRIPKKGRITMCIVLVSAILADTVYTHFNPHTGDGIGGYNDENSGSDQSNRTGD